MQVTKQVGTIKRPLSAYKASRQSFIAVIFTETDCADCYNAFFYNLFEPNVQKRI